MEKRTKLTCNYWVWRLINWEVFELAPSHPIGREKTQTNRLCSLSIVSFGIALKTVQVVPHPFCVACQRYVLGWSCDCFTAFFVIGKNHFFSFGAILLFTIKVKNDHRSKFSNLSNWKEETWKNQGFNGSIAQLVEHRIGIAEVTGSNPVEALIFSGFFFPIA